MAGRKTRDGFLISGLTKLVRKIEGISIEQGRNHPVLLKTDGHRPCPLATSTHTRKMLVPWLAQVTGYTPNQVYTSIQSGRRYH